MEEPVSGDPRAAADAPDPVDPPHVDLLMFPHLDMHAVVNVPLQVDVVLRQLEKVTANVFTLVEQLQNCTFEFIAPHNPTGHRFDDLPTVVNGSVQAAKPGVYLFQVRVEDKVHPSIGKIGSLVGRLQVHSALVDWWFGIDSITTAVDGKFGHAQPSVYAQFSEDPGTGCDLVGDITGHSYVTLTSPSPKVVVMPWGRLRGVTETVAGETVQVTGAVAGVPNPTQPPVLPVRVFDYTRVRNDLEPVGKVDAAGFEDMFNIVFLAEGFTAADKPLFDRAVAAAKAQMFDRPRHEPFHMLSGRFNVFKAFTPSQQRMITCGNRVTDNTGPAQGKRDLKGLQIPFPFPLDGPGAMGLNALVERVGLPKRGENRPNLPAIWAGQSLPGGFDVNALDADSVEVWKAHQAAGILQAADTMFGLYVGDRLADGSRVRPLTSLGAPRPAADTPSDQLTAFIGRVYDFYKIDVRQSLRLDPRRHPPELFAPSDLTCPGNAVLNYAGNLAYSLVPHPAVGKVWVPDDTAFKRSRGLVAIICYDDVAGGENINNTTLTASTLADEFRVASDYPRKPHTNPNVYRRTDKDLTAAFKSDRFVSRTVHEFGHTFNLGDEYEENGGDADPFIATAAVDIGFDNLSTIGFLRVSPAPDRHLDINKVKWFGLPRATVSGRLQAASSNVAAGLQVSVGPKGFDRWVKVFQDKDEVVLRRFEPTKRKGQLPLLDGNDHVLANLRIASVVDQATGTFVLSLLGSPPPAAVPFPAGSAVYVPKKDASGVVVPIVPRDVEHYLTLPPDGPHVRLPLNADTEIRVPNPGDDVPAPGPFRRPLLNSFRLVGIFEGGGHFSRGVYRASGACKMRTPKTVGDVMEHAAFCYLCKWLIVNLVDPGQHALLSDSFYPEL
ncbi:hypothetical protein [Actinomadura sp. NTSP31]|uniref:hypothetical protein n=1 Tax=Actinomadura sp. NTSP31 TaxID=1735447 RepID=UPI0035BFB535